MSAEPERQEVTAEQLDRLIDATSKLASVAGGNHNTSGVHIHGGGLLAVCVALIGVFAIQYGVSNATIDRVERAAELRVLAEARRADMQELKAVRSIAETAQTQAQVAKTAALTVSKGIEQRITALEARQ